VSCETVKDPVTGSIILKKNTMIEETNAKAVEKVGVEQLKIRSVTHLRSSPWLLREVLRPQPGDRKVRQDRAKRSASLPRSRSASPAPSSRCVPSTSAAL
jgi:hypothetical protein